MNTKEMTLADVRQIVKEHGRNPRVHPNGFIQLDIGPVEDSWDESKKRGHSGSSTRLHIWNPPAGYKLPRQGTVNEIHDHVFDMRSTVIKGTLEQRLYWFVVGANESRTHELYTAVYDKKSSSRLNPSGIFGTIKHHDHFSVHAGDTYLQPAFTLHDTYVPVGDTVVTVMEKARVHDGDAHVVCPTNTPPDNDFDRAKAAPHDWLWAAINSALSDDG